MWIISRFFSVKFNQYNFKNSYTNYSIFSLNQIKTNGRGTEEKEEEEENKGIKITHSQQTIYYTLWLWLLLYIQILKTHVNKMRKKCYN